MAWRRSGMIETLRLLYTFIHLTHILRTRRSIYSRNGKRKRELARLRRKELVNNVKKSSVGSMKRKNNGKEKKGRGLNVRSLNGLFEVV